MFIVYLGLINGQGEQLRLHVGLYVLVYCIFDVRHLSRNQTGNYVALASLQQYLLELLVLALCFNHADVSLIH